jgi:hypothetical protein
MRFCVVSVFILIIAVTSACNARQSTSLAAGTPVNVASPISATSNKTHGLSLEVDTGTLSIWTTESDRLTAQDVARAIESTAGGICSSLQTPCQFSTVVEIYPDQASFDQHVMNRHMRGYFAVSGQPYKIQLVSPANPQPHQISYRDGVQVAVHEFVHLALDEINPSLPAWLDEGTAVYFGPHDLYVSVCQSAFPIELSPSFQQLTESYEDVTAPDLFAYAAVEFIVHEYGVDQLNQLLRSPEELEGILGVSPAEFEARWRSFMKDQYHTR